MLGYRDGKVLKMPWLNKPLILEVNATRLATVEESQVSSLATLNTSVPSAELDFNLTFRHCLWLKLPVHTLQLKLWNDH